MVVRVPCSSVKLPCRFIGEDVKVSTVCVCVPVLVLAVVDRWDQCWLWHLFSRVELSRSLALLHDSRASLFLDTKT